MQLDRGINLVTYLVYPGLPRHCHAFARHDAGVNGFRLIDQLTGYIAITYVFAQSESHVAGDLGFQWVVHSEAYSSNGEVPIFADFC